MMYLRKATLDDMDIIYEWANDPAVRAASFNTEKIPYESHKRWYEKILADDNVIQYIFMVSSNPVGQIRLNICGEEAEISYSISPQNRGKGYAGKMLSLMYDDVNNNMRGISKLVAKVKPDNMISSKVFEGEGYSLKYHCYELNVRDL